MNGTKYQSEGAMDSLLQNSQATTPTVNATIEDKVGPSQKATRKQRHRDNFLCEICSVKILKKLKGEHFTSRMHQENYHNLEKTYEKEIGDVGTASEKPDLLSKYSHTIKRQQIKQNCPVKEEETMEATPSVSGGVPAQGNASKVNKQSNSTKQEKSSMVRCEVCDAHFDAKCRAEHEAGRRHTENVAYSKRADCTVFVNGQWKKLFRGVRDIIEYFSTFGRVQVNVRSGLKLVYDEKECVDALIEEYENSLKYDGLIIKRQQVGRTFNNPRANHEQNKVKVPAIPTLSGDFDAQLTALISHIELTKEETENLHRLTQDLETTLRLQWPGCRAIPFGSLVTGLGIKGSDVDCFIHLMHTNHEGETQPNYVNKAKNLLQSRGRHLFKDVFAIPRAKTPIVKLVHIPTGASCDMNFQNCLGVMNSNLISYLQTVDPRVRPALLFLKYWSKVYNMHRKGLSNYALSMIFFFYLQQKPHLILPPVELLQRDSRYDNLVKGWNCGFMYDSLPELHNKSNASVLQLLEGFFSFYADLDFTKYILSPYTGKLLPRDSLDVDERVKKIFSRYMENVKQTNVKLRTDTTVCVQDPFEHAHNLLTGLAYRCTVDLQNHFRASAQICRRALLADDTHHLTHNLLTQQIKLSRAPKHILKIRIKPRGVDEKQISERVAKASDEMAKSVILDIFTRIFKCKVTAEDEENGVRKKNKAQKNDPNVEENLETFCCTMAHDVWSQRDKNRKGTDNSQASALAREEAISDRLIRDAGRQCLSFNFNLSFNNDVNPQSPLIFMERGDNATDIYQVFVIFVQAILHTLYYTIMGELFQPVETMIFENKKFSMVSRVNTGDQVESGERNTPLFVGDEVESRIETPTDTNESSTSDDSENSSEERPMSACKHELSPVTHPPPFKVQKNH